MKTRHSPIEHPQLLEMAHALAEGKDPDLEGLSPLDLKLLINEFRVIAEKKAAQKAQRQNEISYRQMLVSIPGMVFTNRPDGYCDYVSPQWTEYTGITSQEQYGTGWVDLLHPEDRARALSVWRRAVKREDEYDLEYRVRRHDGIYEWFKARGNPIRDTEGQIVQWIGMCMRIEELKRAEEALHHANERLQLAIDATGLGLFDFDVQGGELTWSERAKRHYGLSPEAPADYDVFLKALHPHDRERVHQIVQDLLRPGRADRYKIEYRTIGIEDGRERWLEDRGQIFFNKEGNPARVIGATLDITESKKAEEALRQSEALYHSLFADNHACMLLIDPDGGEIVDANEAAAVFYGYSRQKLMQMRIPDLNTLPSKEIRERMEQARQRGRGHFEFRHRLSSGEEREVDVYSGPVRRGGKDLLYSIIHDITDRKRAETELLLARKAADEANRAKSEFLANMSHEIRTPMTIIMAAMEHVLDSDPPAELLPFLEMVDHSSDTLLSLINDILDFSRIEARHMEIEEKSIPLRPCLEKSVMGHRVKAQKKDLEFELRVAPELPEFILGDCDRLSQILLNLIENAIKFTEKGGVVVSVESTDSCAPSGVRFSVSDSGIGIPADRQRLLFQSFSQLDSSRAKKYGGTGLGLAISKGLVELMGGEITMESKEGEGSVFSFILPLKGAEPDFQPKAHPTEKVINEKKSPPARILLVEDDSMVRDLIEQVLTRRKWEVVTVENGREAVEISASEAFDLVLMDVQMPEMDGHTATRTIREREARSGERLPIIALTAYARDDDRQGCLEAGMDGYISKPIKTAILYSTVEEILDGKKEPGALC
jgi:PAS domain S-box-containing protein